MRLATKRCSAQNFVPIFLLPMPFHPRPNQKADGTRLERHSGGTVSMPSSNRNTLPSRE
jgi:hypothetical protein